MKLSLLFEHSNLRDMLQLLKYVYMNVARNIQIKKDCFDPLLFSHRIEKTYKKGLWNTEERKGH